MKSVKCEVPSASIPSAQWSGYHLGSELSILKLQGSEGAGPLLLDLRGTQVADMGNS